MISVATPDDALPADELDPAIVELCCTINEFPGIKTSESCQGFIDNHRPGEPWAVYFAPDPSPPTPEGYASIEFLAYACGNEAKVAGFDVRIGLNAPPPALNGPGRCLYFTIKGMNRHPDEFAAFLRQMRDMCFALPGEDDE
jgi:hypothetical protein